MKTRDKETTMGPGDLEEEAILRLWDTAWQMARRRCGRTLARLRRGDGGFYGAEDFRQDLFIEFWELLERCGVPQDDQAQTTLWETWRSILWGGGRRILRRVPQRLWAGAEWAIDPRAMTLEYDDPRTGDDNAGAHLPASAREELVHSEDAESTRKRLHRVEHIAHALWELQPLQRQIIYMSAMRRLPAAQVARRLRLSNRNTAYQRLHRARKALRLALRRTSHDA
jgi:DNA-directed RNA polymerase specialized sigma24 family protein